MSDKVHGLESEASHRQGGGEDPSLSPTEGTSSGFKDVRAAASSSASSICNYSETESSDDEGEGGGRGGEEEEEEKEEVRATWATATSPKKRRRTAATTTGKQDGLGDLLLPVGEGGELDVDVLFGGEFDPLQSLSRALERTGRTTREESGSKRSRAAPERQTEKKKEEEGEVKKEEQEEEDSPSGFRQPKLRNRKFLFKAFVRHPDGRLAHDEGGASADVVIPEQLAASYGLYIWPSSPVLGWYLWLHQEEEVRGRRVLELGAGTALPGLLCAKAGAEKVYLADIASERNILQNCREAVR